MKYPIKMLLEINDHVDNYDIVISFVTMINIAIKIVIIVVIRITNINQ